MSKYNFQLTPMQTALLFICLIDVYATPQSGNRVSTSLNNSGLCWTIFAWNRHCGACRRKWWLTDTDLCPCGETQTMSHTVKSCPDKSEWRLISTTLCGWRCCFVANQLWSMKKI